MTYFSNQAEYNGGIVFTKKISRLSFLSDRWDNLLKAKYVVAFNGKSVVIDQDFKKVSFNKLQYLTSFDQ